MESLNENGLEEALRRLRAGQLVAIPTETVYGLAADATQPDAIRRVFAQKGRPSDHPLILHLGAADWAEGWAELPESFAALAARYWPGPLTLVVPRKPSVSPLVTGGQDTVALRVPRHPLTLELLNRLGRPLVAPSANRFGRTSPTRPEHVRDEFAEAVFVLDGGPCPVGVESTIVDLSHNPPRLLRPGQLHRAELETVLGCAFADNAGAPRVPGALDRHYAPETPTLFWREGESLQSEDGWLGFSSRGLAHEVLLPGDADGYAHGLYAALRQLDAAPVARIWVEAPPSESRWEAVWDRLRRAVAEHTP